MDVILIQLDIAQRGYTDCLRFIWCLWIKQCTLLAASETSCTLNNFKCKYSLTMKIYLRANEGRERGVESLTAQGVILQLRE